MAPQLAQFEQQMKSVNGVEVVDVNVDHQDEVAKYKQYKKSNRAGPLHVIPPAKAKVAQPGPSRM